MDIGVLREIKEDERRVALQPIQAQALSRLGHKVYVEISAGEGAGYSDADYEAHGGEVVTKDEVLAQAQLLLKVKAPLRSEYSDYTPRHILFAYLHFDENIDPQDISELTSRGFLGIAYEWVGKGARRPLLEPMSRLTGYLFAQRALELCSKEKGVFCPRNENFLPGGRALIIGCGNIGLSAFKYLSDLGLAVTVVVTQGREDFNSKANKRFETDGVDYIGATGTKLIVMDNKDPSRTQDTIAAALPEIDIVLNCAVRRSDLSKRRMEYLIDRSMVRAMQRGSILCDCTACDRDLVETCISSASLYHSYFEEDIVHYNCDHIPSMVASTATRLLTARTFSYIRKIASLESFGAIAEDEVLRNAVCCYGGHLTHVLSAEKKCLPYRLLSDVIEAKPVPI
ncbi:putative Alanine dehydrogenase [Mesorhizobium plurifarium]|uniref:Putative Alanine dehydrogenase n=1 Tax=Mesorhizobium plurifarium TaxID=69974 RepID=A0A090EIK8_MESPL|nr:putative Alanine dehydrogenase [Mesorhizobium plurifarium]